MADEALTLSEHPQFFRDDQRHEVPSLFSLVASQMSADSEPVSLATLLLHIPTALAAVARGVATPLLPQRHHVLVQGRV